MKKGKLVFHYLFFFIVTGLLASSFNKTFAQETRPYVRIATIVVDSLQLNNYKTALKEHAEAAVAKEPGVLTLYAVYHKERPTHVTVFEIYADVPAYQSHILTTHFLKYKTTVSGMVKSLVLTDVVPIALEAKSKI
ncbi:MAG: antibiotic biosynthesis monooxygenase [Bacteroidota bacterium]